MGQLDNIIQELTTYTNEVEQIKSTTKTIAENKNIAIEYGVDDALSLLGKIDSGTIATPTETINITENGVIDVTNYASANVNVPSGTELPAYMSAKNFTFDGNACTGWDGPSDINEIVIPRSYSIGPSGNFIDGNDYQVTSVAGVNYESGFKDYQNRIILLSNLTSIGESAFWGCSGLTSIEIPSSVQSIGEYAFNRCTSLSEITIPSGVTSIGTSAFRDCFAIETVTFGDNSQLESIGNYVFYSCSSLKSITIPSSVTSIGVLAFFKCTNLTTVTLEAITPPTIQSNTFDDTVQRYEVPAESVETYKTATNWANYADKIQPLSAKPTQS